MIFYQGQTQTFWIYNNYNHNDYTKDQLLKGVSNGHSK